MIVRYGSPWSESQWIILIGFLYKLQLMYGVLDWVDYVVFQGLLLCKSLFVIIEHLLQVFNQLEMYWIGNGCHYFTLDNFLLDFVEIIWNQERPHRLLEHHKAWMLLHFSQCVQLFLQSTCFAIAYHMKRIGIIIWIIFIFHKNVFEIKHVDIVLIFMLDVEFHEVWVSTLDVQTLLLF